MQPLKIMRKILKHGPQGSVEPNAQGSLCATWKQLRLQTKQERNLTCCVAVLWV